uniref:ATP synthase complex subunit 8 n=1 Tax=Citharoides macrolepidotus TaxID=762039 RepID=A0A090BWN5_9PLEU|nr:ATP synthase F0 subunit 8 [Citharoides macrolepidotus]BAP58916.1 ATPase subunit 8 [Citharoides macrolepidotus]
MPQLNPTPWLFIFLLSWVTFVFIIIPQTTTYTFPNEPTPLSTKALNPELWQWLWY